MLSSSLASEMPAKNRPSLQEHEELDSCSLCLKTFTNPKILPCFHTYDLHCLQAYTETNAHKDKFACPLCACACVIPSGGLTDLQTNFYIKAAQTKSEIAANSTCDICEDGPRAEKYCLECEQNLCQPCSRSHLKMKASRDHHLVALTERSHAGEGQVISKSFCDKHKAEELNFYCRKCAIPICLRCKVTSHEQHASEDLCDVAREIRVVLTDMLKDAQKVLPGFHGNLNDITTYGDKLAEERKRLRAAIEEQTRLLHEAIDRLCSNTLNDLDDEHKVETARLDTRRKMISDRSMAFSAQLHSANQVISYGSDADIARNRDSLAVQLRTMADTRLPSEMVRLSMAFEASDQHATTAFNDVFGKLNKSREPMESLEVEEFSSFSVDNSFKAVSCVCPTDDGGAWLALGWTANVHLCHRHGLKAQSHVASRTVDCIARDTTTGSLLISSNEQKMVGRPGPGFNLDPFASFPGYHPRGLTVTSGGDVLICLAQSAAFQDYRPSHKNKIVKLTSEGKMTSEYGADGDVFMYPLRVAVNVNDDVCVSDSRKLSVVVVRATGEVKAEYSGAETAELKNMFEPRGVACDSRGHIFVADSANHAVHLLDHAGRFMQLLVTEDDGLFGPYSVAVDREDYLWVGCRDADVKVYKLNWA